MVNSQLRKAEAAAGASQSIAFKRIVSRVAWQILLATHLFLETTRGTGFLGSAKGQHVAAVPLLAAEVAVRGVEGQEAELGEEAGVTLYSLRGHCACFPCSKSCATV